MKQQIKDYWYIEGDTTKLVTVDWKKIRTSKDSPKKVYSLKSVNEKPLSINQMDKLTKKYLEVIRLNKKSYWVDLDNKMHIIDYLLYEQTSNEIERLAKILSENTRKELGYSKEEWRKIKREEQRKCDL